MQRLLKISLDQALLSLTPILSWFCLSLILDKDLINVFSLVYPLQYFCYIIRSPFSTGANISRVRDRNKDSVMSGIVLGIITTVVVFSLVLLNLDPYIEFMHMDVSRYHTFAIYAVILIAIQTVFSFILDKLYYTDQNAKANRYSIIFNILVIAPVNLLALLTKNHTLIVSISLTILSLYTIHLLVKNWQKFHFHINLFKCLRYDSVNLASYLISFFVFLFGFSSTNEFGPEYSLAFTFSSLITDTQWDTIESVSTKAKIDISKNRFNLKKSFTHAYKLVALLLLSTCAMFIGLYWFYDLNLQFTLIYLGFEVVAMIFDPIQYLYTAYLQLKWSASKTTANKVTGRLIRLGLTMLPTPFCNGISLISHVAYQTVTTRFLFHKHFTVSKTGTVRKRPTRKSPSRRFRYNDIVIDED